MLSNKRITDLQQTKLLLNSSYKWSMEDLEEKTKEQKQNFSSVDRKERRELHLITQR